MKKKTIEQQLSLDIDLFVEKYAKISPNYDGISSESKYTSPDIYQLLLTAHQLDKGLEITYPWSEWGCGGYGRYSDQEGRKIHDDLMDRIKILIKK